MTTSTDLITAELASSVANAFESPESLEAFVAALPAESVALYLARLTDAAANVRALIKGLEQRLAADGQTGQRWTIGGLPYSFDGAQKRGYDDYPGLVRFLVQDCGMPVLDIAEATSDARVTQLREAASRLPDPEKREAALAEIAAHRVPVGARGAPRFQLIDEAHISK